MFLFIFYSRNKFTKRVFLFKNCSPEQKHFFLFLFPGTIFKQKRKQTHPKSPITLLGFLIDPLKID